MFATATAKRILIKTVRILLCIALGIIIATFINWGLFELFRGDYYE
jgi:hypothetical protein